MTHLHQIAERVMNRPLLIHPDKATVIMDVLSGRIPNLSVDKETMPDGPDADRFFGSRFRNDRYSKIKVENGIAVISIVGSLVNRGAWIGANSGLVSYEGIRAQLDEALKDPEVHTIILDLDSPGGEALGMVALASRVREINAIKPVIAVVNDMAASAAYGIASQASRIVVSPTSITGSIGVVMMHADRSQELAEKGIAVTLIYAGDHKVDGHPFGPLPDGVKADLQNEVAKHYKIFTELIAQGRGEKLNAEAARATQARVFLGAEAIENGLADEVGSFDEVVADLATSTASTGGFQTKERHLMSKAQNTPATQPETGTPEANAAAIEQARAEGRAEGASAERARIKGILTCDAAAGREAQAQAMALETEMTAEQATPVLEAAPKASKGDGKPRTPSIEQRAAEQEQIGNDANPPKASGTWDKFTAKKGA